MIKQNISCEMVGEHLLLMDVFPHKSWILYLNLQFSSTIKLCEMHNSFCKVAQHMQNYGRRLHDGWNFWK